MNKDFSALIEKAKTDKKLLKSLKQSAVIGQDFELAASLREMEKECFPETEEIKKDREMANKLNLLFRMVDVNPDPKVGLLMYKAIKLWEKKKGKFSIEDAIDIKFNVEKTFE